jgi:hypothetical protein
MRVLNTSFDRSRGFHQIEALTNDFFTAAAVGTAEQYPESVMPS